MSSRPKETPQPKAGKYTFEDIHHALFPTPPTPRTLEELKEAITLHLRKKHARDWVVVVVSSPDAI